MTRLVQHIKLVVLVLAIAGAPGGAWAQTMEPDTSVQKVRGGKAVEKIVFVKADPSMEVSSSQMITDTDPASGDVTGAHAAPTFQTTAVADPRRNIIGMMNPDGSNAALLKVHGLDPVFAPDGTKIAFCALRNSLYFQIYTMNTDGSEEKRLTDFKTGDACGPEWSRDGKEIAFHAFAVMNPRRNPQVWVMDADGSNQKKLTDHGLDPSWSPDGKHIAFASNRNDGVFQIYVMSADGSNVRQVTKTKTEASSPAWAPDGAAIAYSEATDGDRRGLFLMGADGSEPRRLAFSKHQDFCFPSWSPDGKYLIFTALHRVGAQGVMIGEESPRCEMWSGEYQIFSFDADGKTRQISDSKLGAMRASYGRAVLLH